MVFDVIAGVPALLVPELQTIRTEVKLWIEGEANCRRYLFHLQYR
jgi:hypothetical protein